MTCINATVEALDQAGGAEAAANMTSTNSTAMPMVRAALLGPPGRLPETLLLRDPPTAFWSALRRWAERAVSAGILTVADIRNGAAPACARFCQAASRPRRYLSLRNPALSRGRSAPTKALNHDAGCFASSGSD
jgi:hypothetical protein